jgi:hypothetical protein
MSMPLRQFSRYDSLCEMKHVREPRAQVVEEIELAKCTCSHRGSGQSHSSHVIRHMDDRGNS